MRYVDLFAGCGGLTLGLEKAGFKLELAVEKSDMASETFYHNFIKRLSSKDEWEAYCSQPIEQQFESKLIVDELRALLDHPELIKKLKAKEIDLLVGGPPCQGFSMAGRRNPDDVRNQLPWQFLDLIDKISPKAVLIENVAGMRQNFLKHDKEAPFEQLRMALIETGQGYQVQPVLLNAMHFGVPQHRPRVMLLAVRNDIASGLGIEGTEETWKSEYTETRDIQPVLTPVARFFGDDIRTVEDALWDIGENGYKLPLANEKYQSVGKGYAKLMREDIDWMPGHIRQVNRQAALANHNKRKHADHIEARFRLYQYLQANGIPSKILNIVADDALSMDEKRACLREKLANAKFPARGADRTVIAEYEGELVELIMHLTTRKHSQRPLKLYAPSPTVLSLPDDFVHPTKPRTMTVREMARFQSFPDSFEFRSKETTGSHRRRFEVPQYTQVGNAVPPLMAQAVGDMFKRLLEPALTKEANLLKA